LLQKNNYCNLGKLFFKANKLTTFILSNSGVSILSFVKRNNTYSLYLKSQFKKKLYSFIYPGQIKKNILLRRKRQVLSRLLSKNQKLVSSVDKFSYSAFYKLFSISQYNIKSNFFYLKQTQTHLNYTNNLKSVYYNYEYSTKGYDMGDLYTNLEVKLPRVRFKPGYQRI
jgi:hypothetical protein